MFLRIELLQEKILFGLKKRMSYADNKTWELWNSFMPKQKEIPTKINTDLYSVEVYDENYFIEFDATKKFEKWAAVEIRNSPGTDSGLEQLIIPKGLYAVFLHKGPGADGHKTYEHIFNNWLPSSGYWIDHRPHFAIMGEKYINDNPLSEEEIWIPIKSKDF